MIDNMLKKVYSSQYNFEKLREQLSYPVDWGGWCIECGRLIPNISYRNRAKRLFCISCVQHGNDGRGHKTVHEILTSIITQLQEREKEVKALKEKYESTS